MSIGSQQQSTDPQSPRLSVLGTLDSPKLPDFLSSSPSSQPPSQWNNVLPNANHTFPYSPVTGVTRYYDFTVARDFLAPDGYNKSGIFVNGQFPGPTIEANWGDEIQVTVYNNITGPEEGTSIHWHGMRQRDTQWYDRVPSISQCPIAPGSSFTYSLRAEPYGTTWWHSHFSAQYTAGVFGPLIVYGPKHEQYDIDVGPVVLGDYYHRDYFSVLEDVAGSSQDFNVYVPKSDNNLINGKNNYNFSMATGNGTCHDHAGLAKFRFQRGKVHRLRLINAGAAALVHFSIDGHTMRVIANDMTPIQPYEASVITLGAAQRTDILVNATGNMSDSFWIRSTISGNCSATTTAQGLGILLYDTTDEETQPESTISSAAAAADEVDYLCRNDPLEQTVPVVPISADSKPTTTIVVDVELFTNKTGHHVWLLNNQTQRADYNDPLLLLASEKNYSYPLDPEWNIYNIGTNRSIRIVMNTNYQSAHPMHIHGHNFYVIAEGNGPWDGSISVDMSNPLRRDVHMLRRYGHLVIQIDADNPGVWSYHCHIAWHASMGFTMNLLERPAELDSAQIQSVMPQTCDAWDKWTTTNVVDQIDAGI